MPWAARLIRVVHAELERLACHLDVIVRLADGAGLAVATTRFGWHKEQVLRLVSSCAAAGSAGIWSFPAGFARRLSCRYLTVASAAQRERKVSADIDLLMGTAARDAAASSAARRAGWCPGAAHARSRRSDSGGS